MDLEVDERGCEAQPKIVNTDSSEKVAISPPTSNSMALKQSPPIQPQRPRPASQIWLFTVFIVVIVLAAVAAGVAGSFAVHQQGKLKSYARLAFKMNNLAVLNS